MINHKEKDDLLTCYNVQTPHQVKERIIWHHLKELVKASYGNSQDTIDQLAKADEDFKEAEKLELEKGLIS